MDNAERLPFDFEDFLQKIREGCTVHEIARQYKIDRSKIIGLIVPDPVLAAQFNAATALRKEGLKEFVLQKLIEMVTAQDVEQQHKIKALMLIGKECGMFVNRVAVSAEKNLEKLIVEAYETSLEQKKLPPS